MKTRHRKYSQVPSRSTPGRLKPELQTHPVHGPLGVPPLGGQGSNVEGIGNENPAPEIFPVPKPIDARPAEAGTPNLSGSWPVTCGEPVEPEGLKEHAASHAPSRDSRSIFPLSPRMPFH
jgi:hypothetical protein